MSTSWTRIPREEASSYPFYGVGGWLALFVTLLIAETGIGFYEMFTALRHQEIPLRDFMMDGDSWAVFPKLVLGVLLVTTLMILAVLFRRAPLFRPMALTALVARGPLFAAAYLYTIRGADGWISLGVLLGVWLLECVIWATYLQRSRRVRVTYESRVKVASHASWTSVDGDNLRYVGDGIATPLKRAKTDDLSTPMSKASNGAASTAAAAESGQNGRAEPSVFTSDPDTIELPDDIPPLPPSLRRKQLMAEAAAMATAEPAPVATTNALATNNPAMTATAAVSSASAAPVVTAPVTWPPMATSSSVAAPAAVTTAAASPAATSTAAPSMPVATSAPPSNPGSTMAPLTSMSTPPQFTGASPYSGGSAPTTPASATSARIAAANGGANTTVANLAPNTAPVFPNLPDNAWEAALDEFEGPQRRRGLWSRVFAQARGDEKRAQADYLLIRARELSMDRNFVESSSRPLI